MINDARDIASVIAYGLRLQELREQHLLRIVSGLKVTPQFFPNGEALALEDTRLGYFTLKNRLKFLPREKAEAVTDAQDYESRCTKLTEALALESHKKI